MGRGRRGRGVDTKNGHLRIRFTYLGKRRTETVALAPTAANLKAAERLAARIRQEVDLGVFDYAATFPDSQFAKAQVAAKVLEAVPVKTVKEYAKSWQKTLIGEKSTLLGYRAQMNKFWLPAEVEFAGETKALGDLPITAVRHTHIATIIAGKATAGASGKTTNNLLIPIRAMFEAAEADLVVDASPLEKVHNRRHQRKPIDPFDRPEMTAIIVHQQRYPATIANYFVFAFATGLRTSELIALQWGDIDWNRRTVAISRAQVRHAEKDTKTHQVREVDLTDMAMGALLSQKAVSFMRGHKAAIFCDLEGKPWLSERRLREQFFQPTLRACGIRQRPAYNTRHTYATLALMAGVNPAYISTQLGHASTAMLFKHYAKWIKGADSGQEAGKLNAAFGPKLVPKTTVAN